MNSSQKLKPVLFPCLRLLPQPPYKSTLQQMRFVHHHKELEVPGGFERFIGWRRSNTHRANRNTHINERKFKRLRGEKRVIIELEDDVERREMEKLMPDQLRIYMLRKGKPDMYKDISPRDWHEHQMTVQSLHDVLDPYVPPETSILTRVRKGIIDDGKDYFTEKWHDIRGYGLRRIKRKDGFGNFDLKEFTKEAETIYVSAFQALAKRDKRSLYDLVTESAFSNLWPDVERGTLQWEFVRFNEPSVVRNVRCIDIPQKSGNDIAQIIVRMHSTQKMALYDKDGHLLLGSMEEPREVLEYVVFENPVANLYGKWRYHAKVYPQWLQQPKQPLLRPKLLEETKAKTKNIPVEPTKLNSGLRNMMQKFDNKSKSGAEEKMDGTENTVKRALKGFRLAGKKDKSK